jgi:hypothetical protein
MLLDAMMTMNWWGILAAAITGFFIAGMYFGALIPRQYQIALGRENSPQEKPSPLSIFGPFLCNIVMIVITAMLMRLLSISSLGDALALGGLVGVGYLLPMCMTIAINPNFPKPFYYTLLNAPYFMVSMLVTCAILYFLS